LYRLSDLSSESHTAEYLTEKINEIITSVGSNKFAAIVSDNASNVRKAREEINCQYPNIQNVRCIAHCINLIACDIIAHKFADKLLRRINILVTFFRNNSRAGKNIYILNFFVLLTNSSFYIVGFKIQEMIEASGISGGGLKLYCKTRWTTSSESVNSVIRLKPILQDVSNMNIITFKF